MYLQKKPRLLPMMFIITADIAGGNATIGEVKCDAANTTPKEEFCIPTCDVLPQGKKKKKWKLIKDKVYSTMDQLLKLERQLKNHEKKTFTTFLMLSR